MEIKNIASLEVQVRGCKTTTTISNYLKLLLTTLLVEEEEFSGKRPFGNSGWIYDLYLPLIKAGLVKGQLDEDGNVEDVDESAAKEILYRVIGGM